MFPCIKEPLSFYVDKLERGEPFSSLLYGDGEFLVAGRMRTGQRMAYNELVTAQLESELERSLYCSDPSVFKGTDPFLVDWSDYQGGDLRQVAERGELFSNYLKTLGIPLTFHDGTVWETTTQTGEFSAVLRALVDKKVVMIANRSLKPIDGKVVKVEKWIHCPPTDAASCIGTIERAADDMDNSPKVFIVCTGLGAIPLIMRLRNRHPNSTFLDLGSTFDLFVKLPSRGWRTELYNNRQEYNKLVAKNLEGVIL